MSQLTEDQKIGLCFITGIGGSGLGVLAGYAVYHYMIGATAMAAGLLTGGSILLGLTGILAYICLK